MTMQDLLAEYKSTQGGLTQDEAAEMLARFVAAVPSVWDEGWDLRSDIYADPREAKSFENPYR